MSALLDLLKPGWHRRPASATSATYDHYYDHPVARVATVAVAGPAGYAASDRWRHKSADSLKHVARQVDEELWQERAGILEFDGDHIRSDAELLAAIDVIKAKGH